MNIVLAVLLSQLGAEDFGTRERAHVALAQLGPAAHTHLMLAERSTDQEVRARARRLLDDWYSENAPALAGAYCAFPWWVWDADVLDGACDIDRQEFRNGYIAEARKIVGYGTPPSWLDERMAAQLLIEDMYRMRRSQAEIDGCLGRMWAAEINYRQKWMGLPHDLPR